MLSSLSFSHPVETLPQPSVAQVEGVEDLGELAHVVGVAGNEGTQVGVLHPLHWNIAEAAASPGEGIGGPVEDPEDPIPAAEEKPILGQPRFQDLPQKPYFRQEAL